MNDPNIEEQAKAYVAILRAQYRYASADDIAEAIFSIGFYCGVIHAGCELSEGIQSVTALASKGAISERSMPLGGEKQNKAKIPSLRKSAVPQCLGGGIRPKAKVEGGSVFNSSPARKIAKGKKPAT